MNLNSELSAAIDLIITNIQTDKDKSRPLGLVLAKFSHQDQNSEESLSNTFLECLSKSFEEGKLKNPSVSTQFKILFRNKNLEKVLEEENDLQSQTKCCSKEFSQKFHLDKILVLFGDNTLGNQTFVSMIEYIKDTIKKSRDVLTKYMAAKAESSGQHEIPEDI